MSEELTIRQVEHGMAFYYIAGIACVTGVITLFFYPPQGIGLILFGGFLLYWVLANISIAAARDMNEKLTEIAAHLDDMKGKAP